MSCSGHFKHPCVLAIVLRLPLKGVWAWALVCCACRHSSGSQVVQVHEEVRRRHQGSLPRDQGHTQERRQEVPDAQADREMQRAQVPDPLRGHRLEGLVEVHQEVRRR